MENNNLLVLFEGSDIGACELLCDTSLDGLHLGMTPFQIRNFVLNRREFPTDFAQFQQVKLELYQRIQTLFDLYYQFKKAQAEIKLYQGQIEELLKEPDGKVREASIELKQIEIDKNEFQLANIRKTASDKLQEAMVFFERYKQLVPEFADKPAQELLKAEETAWKIKSAYYPELFERYGLTPSGFLKLPHEVGGLQALIEIEKQQLKGGKMKQLIKVEQEQE